MIKLKAKPEQPGSMDGLGQAEGPSEVKSMTLSLLQQQVEHEFFAERLYLAQAVWLDMAGYPETARFFSEHAQEEKGHAMEFVNFILKRGEKVIIPGTKEPPVDFEDAGAVIRAAIDHERFISTNIAEIYAAALEEGDIMTLDIAFKYIKEQVEEEQLFTSLLKMYELEDKISIDMEAQIRAFMDGAHRIGTL